MTRDCVIQLLMMLCRMKLQKNQRCQKKKSLKIKSKYKKKIRQDFFFSVRLIAPKRQRKEFNQIEHQEDIFYFLFLDCDIDSGKGNV